MNKGLAWLLAMGMALPAAGAEIYKWQEQDGGWVYSDRPPLGGQPSDPLPLDRPPTPVQPQDRRDPRGLRPAELLKLKELERGRDGLP